MSQVGDTHTTFYQAHFDKEGPWYKADQIVCVYIWGILNYSFTAKAVTSSLNPYRIF